ncbi:MAG: ABC transporter ATP-binding protein [Desulfuromonadales bacterium]
MPPLLEVSNLMTYFFTSSGLVKAIRGIEFSLEEGETLALVGESGCGKSMTALSLLRLVPSPGRIVEGEIRFRGNDLLHIPEEEMRRIRGNQISMIFQEPMTSLNPVFRIGEQIGEVLRLHKGMDDRQAWVAAADLLAQVGIPSPERRVHEYPHQLSGGMRQRVVIAMALAGDPKLLIADEPTTALDVTIQAQIMELLKQLKEERKMATLLITHDLGVVAESADRVAIMNSGLIMEHAPVQAVYANPAHPYTRGLLGCIPRLGEKKTRLAPVGGATSADLPPGSSFLDFCPPPFAPKNGKIPPLREIEAGHFVRCWSV